MLVATTRHPRRVRLTDLSDEVLQHVAFFCAEPFLGTPASIVPFQLVCRKVYSAVGCRFAPYLYGRIFRMKFDVDAPMRRLGEDQLRSSVLAEELRKRCEALKRIRRLEIAGPNTLSDLWLAYLMFLEHDVKNARQLVEWANIRSFVMHFVRTRLYENSLENRGWPLENDGNALAIWIIWHSFDEESIKNESIDDRNSIISILQPYVIASFKYQPLFIPDIHFALPISGTPSSNPPRCVATDHGPYPVYRPPIPANSPCITHFGSPITLCVPPLTPAALLCAHVRRQLGVIEYPQHIPKRRADLPPGLMHLTVEDFDEWNQGTSTRCSPAVRLGTSISYSFMDDEFEMREANGAGDAQTPSQLNEDEWLRITHCYNPWLDAKIKIRIFTPGMLDGLWSGRIFTYTQADFLALAASPQILPDLSERFPRPIQYPVFMRLREHHCLGEDLPLGWGQDVYEEEADGLPNAYFPPGVNHFEKDGKLHLIDPTTDEHLKYETYVPGRPNSHVAAGGCSFCRPDTPMSPVQQRECERIFADEGLGMDVDDEGWDDSVADDCITDIVITGETDFDHGRAWGFFRLIGRVRDRDGLVVLLRTPERPNTRGAGTFIFRGYVHSNQNFVGRWRAASESPEAFSALEGSFSLCKRS
ncbi:hypothetical protein SCHPADRAFT_887747 [Schizopora paradoxa]|uniref:F-box domain-containing protein n=1 Tax=Schizopora paradoxa TaxID=27342 RepID=A0A0H2RY39_9AGAM|nr:hypothetical protein SCHPADRAFT_887747 [Schizopora paradoxa]